MELDPGLLAAIIESPDDDVPRLISADWLEDHGEHIESQLIRSQLADPTSIQIGWMNARNPMQLEYFPEGPHEVESLLNSLGCSPAFIKRRGFIESITTCWFYWDSHHEIIRASFPVREVRLKSWGFISEDGQCDQPDAVVLDFLKTSWPRITFINTGIDC